MKVNFAGNIYCSIYQRAGVLELATERLGRELAIIVIPRYIPDSNLEEPVKLAWANDLQRLSYKRIIFCWAGNKPASDVDDIPGLEVRDGPQVTKLSAAK